MNLVESLNDLFIKATVSMSRSEREKYAEELMSKTRMGILEYAEQLCTRIVNDWVSNYKFYKSLISYGETNPLMPEERYKARLDAIAALMEEGHTDGSILSGGFINEQNRRGSRIKLKSIKYTSDRIQTINRKIKKARKVFNISKNKINDSSALLILQALCEIAIEEESNMEAEVRSEFTLLAQPYLRSHLHNTLNSQKFWTRTGYTKSQVTEYIVFIMKLSSAYNKLAKNIIDQEKPYSLEHIMIHIFEIITIPAVTFIIGKLITGTFPSFGHLVDYMHGNGLLPRLTIFAAIIGPGIAITMYSIINSINKYKDNIKRIHAGFINSISIE